MGQKGRRRGRVADMTIYPSAPKTWSPPPKEDCTAEVSIIWLSQTEQVVQRQHFYRGRIVDFAMMYQVAGDLFGGWVDVARIDCCHGMAHLHIHQRGQPGDIVWRELRTIKSQRDVDDAWDQAADMMFEDYQELKRRWRSGS